MEEGVIGIARRSAERLAPSQRPGVVGDVEAALACSTRPGQFVDPVSVGALVVAVAQFAWQVYQDRKKDGVAPSREVLTRAVRLRLRDSEHAPGPRTRP